MAKAHILKSRWRRENDLGQARKTSQAGFTEIGGMGDVNVALKIS